MHSNHLKLLAVAAAIFGGLACQSGGAKAAATTDAPDSGGISATGNGGIITSDAVVASDANHPDVAVVDPKADAGASKPVFNADIGMSCAITGACPVDMKCLGVSTDSPTAYCSETCSSDKSCPPSFACKASGNDNYCQPRQFCGTCKSDEQCGAGNRCVTMGDAKFCSKSCNVGKTECPRFAACQDVAEGGSACVHSAGTCAGDGTLCATCAAEDNCAGGAGGMCLTFNSTHEQFCSAPCGSGGTCPSGFSCVDIATGPSTKVKECVPGDKTQPKCVKKIFPQMEEGDTIDEFLITGYQDTDNNGSVLTTSDGEEQVRVIKFSEFADSGYKTVLFNVAAGWCGPCQEETKTFKALVAKYPDLGIYQVIFDGTTPGTLATVKLAKSWASALKGQGAVGVDPERKVTAWNTAGSTPLNMIVDAKSRKILKKINGAPAAGIGSIIAPYMK